MNLNFVGDGLFLSKNEYLKSFNNSCTELSLSFWREEQRYVFFSANQGERIQLKNQERNIQCRLLKIKDTLAYIGRGSDFGKIPFENKEKVYDFFELFSDNFVTEDSLFCMEINLLPQLASGTYSIWIEGREHTLLTKVVVKPFDIKETQEGFFSLELWQYPFAVARFYGVTKDNWFGKKHEELVKENLREYKKAGGDTVAAAIVHEPWHHQTYDDYPSLIKWWLKNNQFSFDFSDFDTYIQWNFDVDIDKKIKCFSLLPWENQIHYYQEDSFNMISETLEVGSERWQKIWFDFLKAFGEHQDEKGWLKKTYLSIDERPIEEIACVIQLLKNLENQTGLNFYLSGAMNANHLANPLLNEFKDISVSQAVVLDKTIFKNFVKERKNKNLTTSVYNCVGDYPSMFATSEPTEAAYIIWFIASTEANGFLRWALDAWVKNPFEDISHWYWESGDPFLIYPYRYEEKEPNLSPRYIMMKQTINDVRKYRYIQRHHRELTTTLDAYLEKLTLLKGKLNALGAMVASEPTDFVSSLKRIEQELKKVFSAYEKKYG